MELQELWSGYGKALGETLLTMTTFETENQRELQGLVSRYAALGGQAQKMRVKMEAAQANAAKVEASIYADLEKAEAEIRQELTMGKRRASPEAIDKEVFNRLQAKAEKLLPGFRARGLEILALEKDLAEAELEKAMLSEVPFRKRQKMAREFYTLLAQTAGADLPSFKETNFTATFQADARLSDLKKRQQVAAGELKSFSPISDKVDRADEVLTFVRVLPKENAPQILDAWTAAKIAHAKTVSLKFSQDGRLTWKFFREEGPKEKRVAMASSDRERGSSSQV